jgi:hypothetical protein
MLKVLLVQAIHGVPPTTVVPAVPAVRLPLGRALPAGVTLPVVRVLPVVPAVPLVRLPVVPAVPVVPALRVVGPPLEGGALRVVVPAPRVARAEGVVPPSPSGSRRPWIS